LFDAMGAGRPAGGADVEQPAQIANKAAEMETENAVESGVLLFMEQGAFAPL
jgi:hypothetical protein